jgi:hypothetical protein
MRVGQPPDVGFCQELPFNRSGWNGSFVPDPASETYPQTCPLSGGRLAFRLIRFLGRFGVLSDVLYLNAAHRSQRQSDWVRRTIWFMNFEKH